MKDKLETYINEFEGLIEKIHDPTCEMNIFNAPTGYF